MHRMTIETLRDPIARGVISLVVAAAVLAVLLWIADSYLDPGLRKAIIFSGFGLC
jgi:hypothetical protein